MNLKPFNFEIPGHRQSRILLGILFFSTVLLSPFSALAQWRTQTFDLVKGWNAIYLHVDASYSDIEDFTTGTPIKEVWFWNPSSSSLQFIDSAQTPVSTSSNWLSWDEDETDPKLKQLLGNGAYLVNLTENYIDENGSAAVLGEDEVFKLSIKGEPVLPTYDWNSDGQNLIGFSITPTLDNLLFDNFIGLDSDLQNNVSSIYHYIGGELVDDSLVSTNPLGLDVKRGAAYWVDANGLSNDFFGPFQLSLEDLGGVHFGDRLSAYRIRIKNVTNADLTVTLQIEDSESVPTLDDLPTQTVLPDDIISIEGTPPLLVRGEIDTTDLTYGYSELTSDSPTQWELAPAGEPNSETEIILGLNRAAMSGSVDDFFAGILVFTDDYGYTQLEVPVSATVATTSGLWVGEAEVDQVRNDLTFFERNDDGTVFDDEGNPTVLGTVQDYAGVPRTYTQRLIVHVNDEGEMRLLQRIYYGVDKDDGLTRILATVEEALDPDQLGVARRISSVHLPWSSDNSGWLFDGDFGISQVDLTGSILDLQSIADVSEIPANEPDYVSYVFLGDFGDSLFIRIFDENGDVIEDTSFDISDSSAAELIALNDLVDLLAGQDSLSDDDIFDVLSSLNDVVTVDDLIVSVEQEVEGGDGETEFVAAAGDFAVEVATITSENQLPFDVPEYTNLVFLGDLDGALYIRVIDADGEIAVNSDETLLSTLGEEFDTLETLVEEALETLKTLSLTENEIADILTSTQGLLSRAQIVTQVEVSYDNQATNPFIHTYHPDHDNRDAEFNTGALPIGYESFQIIRDIGLLFSLPDDNFDALTAGAGTLQGNYAEEITLIGKEVQESEGGSHFETKNYGIQGSFVLNRITDIAELQND